MKRIFIFFLLSFALLLQAKEVKVLTIGNSFAQSLDKYLERVVESVPDCKVVLGRANLPGCSLERHYKNLCMEEADSNVKCYNRPDWKNEAPRLKEAIQSKKWDIVTLQQASPLSWRPETYRPYAARLKKYVHTYLPDAEIVVHQTWSYRIDDNRLTDSNPNGEWKIDQFSMYKRAKACYQNMAEELNARVIPMGDAVWNYRRMYKGQPFVAPTPEQIKALKYPETISDIGDVVGASGWKKGKNGERKFNRDTIHLNDRGKYLQACVWFGFLFEKSPMLIKFKPDYMSDEEAEFIKRVAEETLKNTDMPVRKKPVEMHRQM